MYKYLLFSEPQSLVLNSSATALTSNDSHYFAITKTKHLIFRSSQKGSLKAQIPLEKALQLGRSENVSLLKVVNLESSCQSKNFSSNWTSLAQTTGFFSNFKSENDTMDLNVSSSFAKNSNSIGSLPGTCSLLLGTSKLNFFFVFINMQDQKILGIQKINFGYKSTLKRLSSNSRFISPQPGLILLISSNFVFYMTSEEPRFKLLKILKEKVISVQMDFQKKDQMYILGKKFIIFGNIQELPGGVISFNETLRLPNKRKFIQMKAMRKKLIFMNKYKQLRIYELDKQDFTYKIEIFQSFKQQLKFSKMEVINGDVICVHDHKYLYCLSPKMNQIWQIINLNDSHLAILPDGQVLKLQSKSDKLFSVAQIKIKTYQKANKINKYMALSKHEKLKIIFGYLTRKFLKKYKFQDYNKVIYNMLLKLNLPNNIIKQPEFKIEVLKLYNLITDFSLKVNRPVVKQSYSANSYTPNNPQVNSGSAHQSTNSGNCQTSSNQKTIPKIKKTMNYMVIKPYVETKLPRKNGVKKTTSENQILEKIMIKGQKHYQKFLRFKAKDPYPKDCIDSVYARFQSRLRRISSGKLYIKNCVRFCRVNPLGLAEQLFFISYKFNMTNNVKLLHCIFMGVDLWLWASPFSRKIYYQVILDAVREKNKWKENKMVELEMENNKKSLVVI